MPLRPHRARAVSRLALLPAAVLVLAGCPGPRAATPAPRGELRVLVYNIHAGKDAAGADNLERVARLLRERGVDVALLQEVDSLTARSGGVDQAAVLGRASDRRPVFGRTLDYQGGGYGIAVLSRFPVRARALVPLPVEPPQARAGGSREPRGALVVTVETPSGPLHVLNTHLDASRDDVYRLQEARRALALVDSLRRLGGPVIAGGDLNAPPESSVLATLLAGGLRDAWRGCGVGEGLTFPAASPVKRIDYLLLSTEIRCLSAEVVGGEASDHRGVLFLLAPVGP